MAAVNIQIIGLDKLLAGFRRAPTTVMSETRRAMTESCLLVEGTSRTLAPRDTGRLQGSIHHRITGTGANLTGEIGPSVAYGLFVERGTRPHRPPTGPLGGWARRHGINPYVLARGIARKGTRAQPFMAPGLDRNTGKIQAIFGRIGAKIVSSIAGGR